MIHRYPRKNIHDDARTVLSVLAHLGHRHEAEAAAAFQAALRIATPNEHWLLGDRARYTLAHFDKALTRLATLDFRFRARLIEACTTAVAHDGRVSIEEAELIRIIGAKLECPIPPLLADA